MDVIKRKDAITLKLKYYFTGNPCKNNLIAKRAINGNCMCIVCKTARNDKINKIINSSYRKTYYQKNKDKLIEATKNWRDDNRKQSREYTKQWKLNNKDKNAMHEQKRRALKLNAIPSWFNEFDEFVLAEAFHLSGIRERITKIKWQVDHLIPLQAKQACGLHCFNNIQVIPQKLNSFKLNKMIFTNPFEWIMKV